MKWMSSKYMLSAVLACVLFTVAYAQQDNLDEQAEVVEQAKAANEEVDATNKQAEEQAVSEVVEATEVKVEVASEVVETTEAQAEAISEVVETTEAQAEAISEVVETTEVQAEAVSEVVKTTEVQTKAVSEVVETTEVQAEAVSEVVETTEVQTETVNEVVETTEVQAEAANEVVEVAEEQAEVASEAVEATGDETSSTGEQVASTEGELESEDTQVLDHLYGGITLDYSRNAFEGGSHQVHESSGVGIRLGYKTDNNVRFSLSGGSTYEFKTPYEGDGWYSKDLWLSVSKSDIFKPTSWLNIGADLRGMIPTSEYSDKVELNTALRGAVTFGFNLAGIADGLRFTFQPRLKKNFHEYTGNSGVNYTEYTLGTLYSLGYGISDWSISVTAINPHSWTYDGTYKNPSLTHIEEIGYQLTDSFSLSLGHTNSTSFFDADRGPSATSQLFDLKSSTFYGTVSYSF